MNMMDMVEMKFGPHSADPMKMDITAWLVEIGSLAGILPLIQR